MGCKDIYDLDRGRFFESGRPDDSVRSRVAGDFRRSPLRSDLRPDDRSARRDRSVGDTSRSCLLDDNLRLRGGEAEVERSRFGGSGDFRLVRRSRRSGEADTLLRSTERLDAEKQRLNTMSCSHTEL